MLQESWCYVLDALGQHMVLRNLQKRFKPSILPEQTESNIKQALKHVLLKLLQLLPLKIFAIVLNMVQFWHKRDILHLRLILELFDHDSLKAVYRKIAKRMQVILIVVI